MNSWLTSPPISPDCASTARKVSPQRSKIRRYASDMLLVAALQAAGSSVERVRVLHQELAAAQQPEPGPQLVAVLPVDLVQVHRQVAVARAVLLGHEARDDLLGGRREAVSRPPCGRGGGTSAAPYAASRPERAHSSSGWSDRQGQPPGRRRRPSPRARSARPGAGPAGRGAARRTRRLATRRISPARRSSRWPSISASAGSSRNVRRKSADMRMRRRLPARLRRSPSGAFRGPTRGPEIPDRSAGISGPNSRIVASVIRSEGRTEHLDGPHPARVPRRVVSDSSGRPPRLSAPAGSPPPPLPGAPLPAPLPGGTVMRSTSRNCADGRSTPSSPTSSTASRHRSPQYLAGRDRRGRVPACSA